MLRQRTALFQQGIRTDGSINPRDATLRRAIRAPFETQSLSDQEGFEVRPKFDGRLIRSPLRRNCTLFSHAEFHARQEITEIAPRSPSPAKFRLDDPRLGDLTSAPISINKNP